MFPSTETTKASCLLSVFGGVLSIAGDMKQVSPKSRGTLYLYHLFGFESSFSNKIHFSSRYPLLKLLLADGGDLPEHSLDAYKAPWYGICVSISFMSS